MTGTNVTANGKAGAAALGADALEAGAFWTTTAATMETVLLPVAVGATAFSTTADLYSRWHCRNEQ